MTNKTVKKWPMNDFLIAFESLIKDHNATLQATSSGYIGVSCGCYMRLDAVLSSENIGNFINDSLRPENQMKEQKMDKQYKYVNAGIKTVGELYDRIDTDDNGCFVGDEQLCIIVDGCSISFENTLEPLSLGEIKQILRQVTTRQPIPWYEVEGVFPCLVKDKHGNIYLATDYLIGGIEVGDNCVSPSDCTPLSPSEAAKYGVECD